MSEVEYRDIAGFPGYRVGDDGSVWTRHVAVRGCIRELSPDWVKLKGWLRRGWVRVALFREEHPRKVVHSVHHLVLEQFVGPRPDGHEGLHGDGNRANNRLSNLRWGTPQENADDRQRMGKTARGERSGGVKLSNEQVLHIRDRLRNGLTHRKIAQEFGVSHMAIGRIARGEGWTHV